MTFKRIITTFFSILFFCAPMHADQALHKKTCVCDVWQETVFGQDDVLDDQVRAPRDDMLDVTANSAIVGAGCCEIMPVFSVLSIIKKRIEDLKELMFLKFEQTWTVISNIDQDVLDTGTILSEKFDETWTILANIDADLNACCTTLESAFDQTWTMLIDIDQDIFATHTILSSKFDATWTVLATIAFDLNDCCTTLESAFGQTWTMLANIDQDIFATKTILCDKFEQTWTVLADIDADFADCSTIVQDKLAQTWTAFFGIDQELDDTCTVLCDKFNQTWTVLEDIAECCENSAGDPCNTAIPLSGPAPIIINSPGTYCLTQDIAGIVGNAITIAADNVVLDLNHKKIVGGGTAISIVNSTDVVVKSGIIDGQDTRAVLVDTCKNITLSDIEVIRVNAGSGIDEVVNIDLSQCIRIERSSFKSNDLEEKKGAVIRIQSSSSNVIVRDSEFLDNLLVLIVVDGDNNQIIGNIINNNSSGSGQIPIRGSHNFVSDNILTHNAGNGIVVGGSQNIISDNTCTDHFLTSDLDNAIGRASGILLGFDNGYYAFLLGLVETTSNVVCDNTCNNNQERGIVLVNTAQSTLPEGFLPVEDNTIKDNICTDNGIDGIFAGPSVDSPPTVPPRDNAITDNECNHNGRYGIVDAGASNPNDIYSNSSIDNVTLNYSGVLASLIKSPGLAPVEGFNLNG